MTFPSRKRSLWNKTSKWASSWDYGTYHIGDLRGESAHRVVSPESLLFAHMMYVLDQTSDIDPHWMAVHARLKNEFTGDAKYHSLMTLNVVIAGQ